MSSTALLSGHRARTIRRLAHEKTALIIQDTADLNFSTRKHCLDLGRIGKNETSTESMGLKMHSAMAVTTETEYPGTNLRAMRMRMRVRRVVHTLALLVALASSGCGGGPTPPPTTPTPTTPLPALSAMLSEKVLGSPTAPVSMIAYSSLTCSHCADFHLVTFPALKTSYIDTGRMKFVFRDFPLNEPAIAASMVARCSGDRFFTTLDALFRTQASWAFLSDYTGGIKSVVAPLGMTANDVDACLASTDLRNGILSIKQGGTVEHGVNATPTFVINGVKVVGALSYAEFASIIQSFQ